MIFKINIDPSMLTSYQYGLSMRLPNPTDAHTNPNPNTLPTDKEEHKKEEHKVTLIEHTHRRIVFIVEAIINTPIRCKIIATYSMIT